MRINCYFTAIALLPLAAVACKKDKTDDKSEDKTVTVSVEAVLPDGLEWKGGDVVGVYGDKGGITNASAALRHGEGSGNGLFEFSTEEPQDTGLYVYVPYRENAGGSAGAVSVTIPSDQSYPNDERTYGIFAGKGSLEGDGCKAAMSMASSVLEITLASDGNFNGQVSRIVVEAEGCTGGYLMDITGDRPVLSPSEGKGSLSLALEGVSLSASGEQVAVTAAIAPGNYEGVIFTAVTGSGEWKSQAMSFAAEAGGRASVSLKVEDPSVRSVDLNADGQYANCYVVSEPGTIYRFDAKVMGTGTATDGIPAPEALEPADAFVLWETGSTVGGIIKSVSLSDEGIVSFMLEDGACGNAVIAVTDGKAVEGEWQRSRGTILWSWHIWACGDVKDVTCTNREGKTFAMMDRNLGDWKEVANADEYHGLKYQWGRKDPFVGFSSSGEPFAGSVCCSEKDYVQVPGAATSADALAEAAAFPEVFFGGTYATAYDWYGSGDTPQDRNDALWGNSGNGERVKTIYDPCPAGYMVAPAEAFTGLTKSGSSAFSTDDFVVDGGFANGWFFTDAASFFPAAGSMAHNNGVLRMVPSPSGREGYYWSSDVDGVNAKMVDFTASYIFMNSNKRAAGCSVRCVRQQ